MNAWGIASTSSLRQWIHTKISIWRICPFFLQCYLIVFRCIWSYALSFVPSHSFKRLETFFWVKSSRVDDRIDWVGAAVFCCNSVLCKTVYSIGYEGDVVSKGKTFTVKQLDNCEAWKSLELTVRTIFLATLAPNIYSFFLKILAFLRLTYFLSHVLLFFMILVQKFFQLTSLDLSKLPHR